MTTALEFIDVYSANGGVLATFPVTDSCERSATLMGDDYVSLSFYLRKRVVIGAFSYLFYDGIPFFVKEDYMPEAKGGYYSYSVKFVSVANMLDKFIFKRFVSIEDNGDKTVWEEPEFALNGNLETLTTVVIDCIKNIVDKRLQRDDTYFDRLISTIANSEVPKEYAETDLCSFSFSAMSVTDALNTIADSFETEWWIEIKEDENIVLHFEKCELGSTYTLKDEYKETSDRLNPYMSGGLNSVSYASDWSNIPEIILPYGSDRNITKKVAQMSVNGNIMNVSYAKRLKLRPDYTYTFITDDGEEQSITTESNGSVRNSLVNTGIEQVEFYEDIYPKQVYKITDVQKKGKVDYPYYTIQAMPIDEDGNEMDGVLPTILPIKIEDGLTLSITFESGLLNGMSFEVRDESWQGKMILTIIPNSDDEESGVMIPFGNFVPNVGDKFALFNMIMPNWYVDSAEIELAKAAHNTLKEIMETRPEVKCESEPEFFMLNGVDIYLGRRIAVKSEIFGIPKENEDESKYYFVSRVISFSHSLTTPNNVNFSLASSRVQGTLSKMKGAIADQTNDIRGLGQRTLSLSRRSWKDAQEMSEMIDSLASEMMLVGKDKWQFSFTSAIEVKNNRNGLFRSLYVGSGLLQHTQPPYTERTNGGVWEIMEGTYETVYGDSPFVPETPYYVYANVEDSEYAFVRIQPVSEDNDENMLLLGILSSEFEGKRVFNRTNGFTQIAGGTITTEQIQDSCRNLIIDFQSNPPRIIARNNAKIIGNIEFYGNDNVPIGVAELDYLRKALPSDSSAGIYGGLIIANVLVAKDYDGNIMSGISGLNDDSNKVAFWAGGTKELAEELETSVAINHDGTGKFGGGYFEKDYLYYENEQAEKVLLSKIDDEKSILGDLFSFNPMKNIEISFSPDSYDINQTLSANSSTGYVIEKSFRGGIINSENVMVHISVQDIKLNGGLSDYYANNSFVYFDLKRSLIYAGDNKVGEIDVRNSSGIGKVVRFKISFQYVDGELVGNASVYLNLDEAYSSADGYALKGSEVRVKTVYSINLYYTTGSATSGQNLNVKSSKVVISYVDIEFKNVVTKNYTLISPKKIAVIREKGISQLILQGLPTSTNNLEVGQVYVDNGVLKIKQ